VSVNLYTVVLWLRDISTQV